MEEHEKKSLDKKLLISRIFLIVNYFLLILSMSTHSKIIDYIYYGSLLLIIAGFTLLVIVKLKYYKKEATYRLLIFYLLNVFAHLVNVIVHLDSCAESFR